MLFLFFQVDDHYERFMNKRKLFAIPKKYECKKGEIYDMKLLATKCFFQFNSIWLIRCQNNSYHKKKST